NPIPGQQFMSQALFSPRPAELTSADGTRIDYNRIGQGPALVICHGSLSQGGDWLWLARRLAPHFTCYIMTRRGRGPHAARSPHALARVCEDLHALLRLAGPCCHLLAHSYGAICALETLRRHHTSPIGRLVLYEPPIRMTFAGMSAALDRLRELLAAGNHD